MDELAVQVEAGFALAIDHGNVAPVCQRRGKDQRSGKIIFGVLEDADTVSAYGKAGAGLVGLGIDVLPRRGKESIIANDMQTGDASGGFLGQVNFNLWPGPHG